MYNMLTMNEEKMKNITNNKITHYIWWHFVRRPYLSSSMNTFVTCYNAVITHYTHRLSTL